MNKEEQPNYYGILPANVRYDKNLTPNAKLVYSELTALCNKEGYCWAGNRYFAELYGVSSNTISTWISSLVSKGHVKLELTVNEKVGTRRKMYITNNLYGGIENQVPPSRKSSRRISNSNINNSNINNTLLHNDNVSKKNVVDKKGEKKKEPIFKSRFAKEFIQEWNSLPYVTKVNITKRTKVIEHIENYLHQLRKGTYFKTNMIDPLYSKRNNIPSKGSRKYSEDELLKAIKPLSHFYKGEYVSKKKPNGSLSSLIYDKWNQYSYLLQAIHNPPKLISDKQVKDNHPEITKFFLSKLNGNDINRNKLISGIRSIVNFTKHIPKKTLGVSKLKREFGQPLSLCESYYEYLDRQEWIKDEITSAQINANGGLWKLFIKEAEELDCNGYKLQ